MKTKFFLLGLLFSSLLAGSQPTITQNDLPNVFLNEIRNTDTTGAGLTITGGGPSQTWDYSSGFNVSGTDTTKWDSPVGSPYASSFPNSNLYIAADTSYFINSATGLYFDGGYDAFSGQTIDFNPDYLFMPVPIDYNNTSSSTAKLQIVITGPFPVCVRVTITRTFTADAWGSLTTPSKNYSNVLRVKVKEVEIDSIFDPSCSLLLSPPSTTQRHEYHWLANGDGLVMTINADSVGTTATDGEYLVSNNLSINENYLGQNTKVLVYPNPANTEIYFEIKTPSHSEYTLTVYNSLGQAVKTENIPANKNSDKRIQISTSDLSDGIYFYTLTDKKARRLQNGKFVISK